MGKFAFWLQLPLAVLAAVAFGAELEPKTIRDFTPGLMTDRDSTLLPDGAAQDLQNVDVEDGTIRKRLGTIKAGTASIGNGQPVRLEHQYIDTAGTFWLLTVSSNTIYKSNDGGATSSVGTSAFGLTSTTRLFPVNAYGKAYFISGSTNAITFDGTSFAQLTTPPLGTSSAFFAGRLAIGSGSTLYLSRVSSDSDWTDSGVDDADAITYVIRSNDGYSITALVPYGPDLLVFKDYSIDRLVLNGDGLNFSLVPIISSLGTKFPETVKVADNRVLWLGHDGVYSYNGSSIKRISENIQPSIEGLSQLSSSGRSYTESTQAQFLVGTSSGVSANVVPDSVVLSTWTDTDTTSSDFSAGSLTNVTTSTYDGFLTLSTDSSDVLNPGFETAGTSATLAANWTFTGNSTRDTSSITPQSGSASLFVGGFFSLTNPTLTVTLLDATGSLIATLETVSASTVTDNAWTQRSLPLTPYAGRQVKVRFSSDGTFPGTATTDQFLCNGGTLSYYLYNLYSTGFSVNYFYVDSLSGGRSSIGSGTFTSQAFDTAAALPRWLASTPTYSANGHSVLFYTQASSNGSSWDSRVAWTPGSAPSSATKQYIRYQVDIATASSGTALPTVADVSLSARSGSGRYKSSHFALTGASSWGIFGANQSLNDGLITYEIFTDTDTTMPLVNGYPTQYVSSQTISIGATPTISTNTYAVVCATFSITSATYTPQMDDFTLRWNEGSASLFPAAMFWDQRYFLALAVNSSTENDTIFVYDRNGAWTKYTGFSTGSMAVFRTRPYIGTSDGYIVRMNEAGRYRDYDDAAIEAYWVSKDFDLGYPLTSKTLVRYYLTGLDHTDAEVTFSYGVERGTLFSTSYSQDSTGFWRQVVKPASLTYSEGIQHRFKFEDDTLDAPMSILSLTGRWNLNTNP